MYRKALAITTTMRCLSRFSRRHLHRGDGGDDKTKSMTILVHSWLAEKWLRVLGVGVGSWLRFIVSSMLMLFLFLFFVFFL